MYIEYHNRTKILKKINDCELLIPTNICGNIYNFPQNENKNIKVGENFKRKQYYREKV